VYLTYYNPDGLLSGWLAESKKWTAIQVVVKFWKVMPRFCIQSKISSQTFPLFFDIPEINVRVRQVSSAVRITVSEQQFSSSPVPFLAIGYNGSTEMLRENELVPGEAYPRFPTCGVSSNCPNNLHQWRYLVANPSGARCIGLLIKN